MIYHLETPRYLNCISFPSFYGYGRQHKIQQFQQDTNTSMEVEMHGYQQYAVVIK